jgi:uncharacterized protein (DUF4415 family)
MEQHDNLVSDSSAARQPVRAEDLVIDQDPPALEEAASQGAIHVSIRLDLDVWRWLLAQGGDYHTRINTLLRVAMETSETR